MGTKRKFLFTCRFLSLKTWKLRPNWKSALFSVLSIFLLKTELNFRYSIQTLFTSCEKLTINKVFPFFLLFEHFFVYIKSSTCWVRAALCSLFVLLPFSRYSFQTHERRILCHQTITTPCAILSRLIAKIISCARSSEYMCDLGIFEGNCSWSGPKQAQVVRLGGKCWNMVSEDPTASEDRVGACNLQPLCLSKKRSDIFFSLELLCSGIIFGLFNNLSTVFNAKNLHDQGYELAAGLSLFFLVFPGNPL